MTALELRDSLTEAISNGHAHTLVVTEEVDWGYLCEVDSPSVVIMNKEQKEIDGCIVCGDENTCRRHTRVLKV